MREKSEPSGRSKYAWLAAGILVVLAIVAVPVFSHLVLGDWPGSPKPPRQINLTKLTGNESNVGSWSQPFQLGMIPIHSVLLKNGNVLMWQYWSLNSTGGIIAAAYDPSTKQTTSLPNVNPQYNYFCGGENQLPNGQILIDGGLGGPQGQGDIGIKQAVVFDPDTMSWINAPSMSHPRYYPTNLALGNGKALAISGFNGTGTGIVHEIEQYNYQNSTWKVLPAAADLPSDDPWEPYPRFFLLPSGLIFTAGPTPSSYFFDPVADTWTDAGDMTYPNRHGEGAVLFGDLKTVMVIGGQNDIDNMKNPATNTTELYDTSQSPGQWVHAKAMNFPRHDLNAVQLPDQTVLVVGGVTQATKYAGPVYQAEAYNPTTGQWKIMAAQQGQRGYHSTAILLPDGTVFSAGSDSGDSLQTYGELYSPPYLFRGARPTITSAPSTLTYGLKFTVSTPDAASITSVVLIRNDADTHATHFDQRLVPLTFTVGSGQLAVTTPISSNVAPPGYYMLFIVNSQGVPSVAPIVSLPLPTS